jgi:hypothetical protein
LKSVTSTKENLLAKINIAVYQIVKIKKIDRVLKKSFLERLLFLNDSVKKKELKKVIGTNPDTRK